MIEQQVIVRAALAAWALLVLLTWGHQLDDAFIHLRYAANLVETGAFGFNAGSPDAGASSPLFVGLLAPIVGLLGPEASKGLSVVATLGALLLVLHAARRDDGGIAGALVLGLAAPSAVRWLANGMETSLALVLALVLGAALLRTSAWVVPVLAVAVLVRIEFVAVGAVLVLALLLERRITMAIALGGAVATGLLAWTALFGSPLPDTAVAKAGQGTALVTALVIAKAHAAAPLLSAGLGVAWVLSLLRLREAVRTARIPDRRRRWLLVLAVQAIVPAVMLAAIARGQVIQGARYFLWLEAFTIAANVALARAWGPPAGRALRLPRVAAVGLVVLFAAEAALLAPVFAGRAQTQEALAGERWPDGATCAAADIGAFAWASGCVLTDLNGLVNGRDAALLSGEERMAQLEVVDLLFLSAPQFDALNAATEGRFARWQPTGAYPFPNVSGRRDVHHVYRPRAW